MIGSAYLEGVSRERSLRAFVGHIKLVSKVRREATVSTQRAAELLELDDETGVERLLGDFDVETKAASTRYTTGAAFLDSRSFLGGLLSANWLLTYAFLDATGKRYREVLRRRIGREQRLPKAVRRRVQTEEDRLMRSLLDEISEQNLNQHLHAEQNSMSDRDAAFRDADWDWANGWLGGLGYDNSGVRMEAFRETILDVLSADQLASVHQLAATGDDLAAVDRLYEVVQRLCPTPWPAIYLARLAGVLRSVAEGYPLPARKSCPAYAPVPGRIFYLAHMRDPYENNGYVTRTHLILKALSGAGLDPLPFTRLGFPSDLARHRDIEISSEQQVGEHIFRSLPDQLAGLLRRPIDNYIRAYADRIVVMAETYRPAAIHAASNYMNGLAAIEAARRLGIPAIYEVRGIWEITRASANDSFSKTLQYDLQRKLENEAVGAADRVITISEPLRRFVIKHGAAPERVTVVPNGVDTEHLHVVDKRYDLKAKLGIPADETVVGYIGSVVHYEGLDLLMQAIARLKQAVPSVPSLHFLLVGDGKALAGLKELASQLGVADRCHFAGRVPHDQVECLYSIIDVAPFPRRSLPVTELVPPLKPFEAMAGGKAVIVSSVEAIAGTVIDGETGLIVEKNSVDSLVEALRCLIIDPALRERLGRQARAWVERERSVDALSRQLAAAYDAIGSSGRQGAPDG